MRPSAIACPHCAGLNSRRSRRKAWLELPGMFIGRYPFRCLDCDLRFSASIWLFSRLIYAKCPKCLSLELTTWSLKHHHLTFWQNLFHTFGAHRYRCSACRCNFLSFRPSYPSVLRSPQPSEQVASLPQTHAVSEADVKS